MQHQRMQIEEVLSRRGWRIAERRSFPGSFWFDEIWTIESQWTPVGATAFVSYIIARHVIGGLHRRPGEHVESVAVSPVAPTDDAFGEEVGLGRGWEKHGLPAFVALIDALRKT